MRMAKVFFSEGGTAAPSIATGWYYQVDLEDPKGPFDTQLDAGKAARATIVETAEAIPIRSAKQLTRGQLERIVDEAQRALWLQECDDAGGNLVWHPDTEWSWERVEQIAGAMIDAGLRPGVALCRAGSSKQPKK
jgi:hypothetical protein